MSIQTVRIEMNDNMLEAVKAVVRAADAENSRACYSISPGKEVQKAFGIDLTKIITTQSKEGNQNGSSG